MNMTRHDTGEKIVSDLLGNLAAEQKKSQDATMAVFAVQMGHLSESQDRIENMLLSYNSETNKKFDSLHRQIGKMEEKHTEEIKEIRGVHDKEMKSLNTKLSSLENKFSLAQGKWAVIAAILAAVGTKILGSLL